MDADEKKIWQLRLHEMTSKLKAEREGRVDDRDGAVQRLKGLEEQTRKSDNRIKDLEAELAMWKERFGKQKAREVVALEHLPNSS